MQDLTITGRYNKIIKPIDIVGYSVLLGLTIWQVAKFWTFEVKMQ